MSKAPNYSDAELTALLMGSEEERDRGLRYLVTDEKLERSVFSKILGMGGSADEAQTAYQEGFIRFNSHVQRGTFRGESSPATFFVSICINYWKDMKRQSWNKKVALTEDPGQYDRPDDGGKESSLESAEWRQLATGVLALTSEDCKKLLLAQAKGTRLKEIAAQLGIKEDSVKNKSFRCREGIRQKAESMPGYVEFVKNILRWL